MRLALGTVQFGVAYGLAGRRHAIPPEEARTILVRAQALGIRTLDTAATYGDIEERLAALIEGLDFEVVSKIPPIPADLGQTQRIDWALAQAERARLRLGRSLRALLLHRAEDLTVQGGGSLWNLLSEFGRAHGIAIGASCYEPAMAATLRRQYRLPVVQLPGNALDQRVTQDVAAEPGFSVHLRSAFLQGLLLMQPQEAARKVPASAAALRRWHSWCDSQGLTPLAAALAVVKSFTQVDTCLVGVDNLTQLEEIASAWKSAAAISAPDLSVAEQDIIDPRRWRAQ